jgi:hypothetical protein
MSPVTADIDRLDAAVLEVFRAIHAGEDYWGLPSYKIVRDAQMKAYAEEAKRSGKSIKSLLQNDFFDPLPLSKLYVQAIERQRLVLAGKLDRYLESRASETDTSHSIVLDPSAMAWRDAPTQPNGEKNERD